MRVAFLADIHSNLPALEAVRADLQLMAPDLVFLVGDQINRCPWPNEVMELIADEGWPAIYGNHELIVLAVSTPDYPPVFDDRGRFADIWWTLARLKAEHFAEIRQLPGERQLVLGGGPPILMMHGLRGDPFEGFSPGLSDAQIAGKLEGIDERIVVSAHTHWPLDRVVAGKRIFNPGSVGMPYNGDTRAQYLLLDGDGVAWEPTFRQVEYDLGLVREAFDRLGLFHDYGPLGPLYWETISTGHPWVSDFQRWIRDQPPIVRGDLGRAVEIYLSLHGPGNWAFIES